MCHDLLTHSPSFSILQEWFCMAWSNQKLLIHSPCIRYTNGEWFMEWTIGHLTPTGTSFGLPLMNRDRVPSHKTLDRKNPRKTVSLKKIISRKWSISVILSGIWMCVFFLRCDATKPLLQQECQARNYVVYTVFSVYSAPGALKIEKWHYHFYPVISAPLWHQKEVFSTF